MNPKLEQPWRRTALLLALGLAILPFRAHAAVETVVGFDAVKLETPENLVFARAGNLYISLALTGEIRKIAPDGTQSTFAQLPLGPPLPPCTASHALLVGLTTHNALH